MWLRPVKWDNEPRIAMRARSVHLVTSWWVVGVWAMLGISTGVLSVVTVLQPAWYVRYTLIHAQEAQGVAFQVIVSSVGPLGFCRLATVDTREEVVGADGGGRSLFNNSPAGGGDLERMKEPSSTQKPFGEFKTPDSQWTTIFSHGFDITKAPDIIWTTALQEELDTAHPTFSQNATQTLPSSDKTSRSPNDSLQEWPPPESHYTTLPLLPTAFPTSTITTDGDVTAYVGNDGEETFTNASIAISVDKAFIDEVVTEVDITPGGNTEYADAIPLEETDTPPPPPPSPPPSPEGGAEGERMKTVHENTQDTRNPSIQGAPIKDERNTSVHKQEIVDGGQEIVDGGQEVDTAVEFIDENITTTPGQTTQQRKSRNKKKRRKHKKRKKKGRRKKTRNNTKNVPKKYSTVHKNMNISQETEPHELNSDTFPSNSARNTSTATTTVNTSRPSGRRTRSRRNTNSASTKAVDRTQQQTKTVAVKYQPRTPILLCSGVTVGVSSGSSAVWVLVGVMYGVAGMIQVCSGVASLITQAAASPPRRYAHAVWVGNVQVAVVMSQGVALVLFPLGLGSPLARGECGGTSSVYWSGDCSFGWAYMLGVVATTLAAYCPCLARLTAFKRYSLKEWESLNFF